MWNPSMHNWKRCEVHSLVSHLISVWFVPCTSRLIFLYWYSEGHDTIFCLNYSFDVGATTLAFDWLTTFLPNLVRPPVEILRRQLRSSPKSVVAALSRCCCKLFLNLHWSNLKYDRPRVLCMSGRELLSVWQPR